MAHRSTFEPKSSWPAGLALALALSVCAPCVSVAAGSQATGESSPAESQTVTDAVTDESDAVVPGDSDDSSPDDATEPGAGASDGAPSGDLAQDAVTEDAATDPADGASPTTDDSTLDLLTEGSEEGPLNGWFEGGDGELYWYDDGVMAASKEVYDPDSNAWYWFDADGTMARDKDVYLASGSKWVRYDSEGHMVKGEDCRYGGWYYFDPTTGEMKKGWMFVSSNGGKWVFYDYVTGQMHHGESCIDGGWYLFDEVTGATTYGWHKYTGKTVYYDEVTGVMAKGEAYVGGSSDGWYYFDEISGALYRGWKWLDSNGGKLVYYDSVSGAMLYGKQKIAGVPIVLNGVTGALEGVTAVETGMTADRLASLQGVTASKLDPFITSFNILQLANLQVEENTVTAAQLDAYIASTQKGRTGTLYGKGQDILDAANAQGIDAVYLLAHAIIESGWGTSSLSAGNFWEAHTFNGVAYPEGNYYNFFGWGAFDSNPYNSGMNYAQMNGWDSVGAALAGGAEVITDGYIRSGRKLTGYSGDASQNTLYEMRWDYEYTMAKGVVSSHRYATDAGWATNIATIMAEFYRYNDLTPSYEYVLPVYD